MVYDAYEILHTLAHGGFFAVDNLDGCQRVSLWQFVEDYCYKRGEVTPKCWMSWLSTGALEYWRNIEDYEGREVAIYFLVGYKPPF